MSGVSDNDPVVWDARAACPTPLREGQRVRIVGLDSVPPAVYIIDTAHDNGDGSWSYGVAMERDESDTLAEFYNPFAED